MAANTIRAELRFLFSADVDPLETFSPKGSFGISVQAMVGPAGKKGEESFDFILCMPEWFAANMSTPISMGRHYLFVREFNFLRLQKFVSDYCSSCEGESWHAVAEKVARLGYWEFEDYRPR